jgi:hypothetical protein
MTTPWRRAGVWFSLAVMVGCALLALVGLDVIRRTGDVVDTDLLLPLLASGIAGAAIGVWVLIRSRRDARGSSKPAWKPSSRAGVGVSAALVVAALVRSAPVAWQAAFLGIFVGFFFGLAAATFVGALRRDGVGRSQV